MMILCVSQAGFARMRRLPRMLEIRAGTLNPKGAQAGFIFGGCYGYSFDERVSLSLGIDYFRREYKQETQIDTGMTDSGLKIDTNIRTLEYTTTIIPLSLNLDIRFPIESPINIYAGGSLTYQMLFNRENNYVDNVKENRFYGGFGWMARAGIEYYLGSRSALIAEAFYNNVKVKGNHKKQAGLPVWEEVDLQGLGFRAGIRLDIF